MLTDKFKKSSSKNYGADDSFGTAVMQSAFATTLPRSFIINLRFLRISESVESKSFDRG